jgi:2-amino-4-hydroxy-6-hydroxymethyldihydropteridine diphosphokinase
VTPHPRIPVAIALGSNIGDRLSHLNFAIARLGDFLSELEVSHFRETDPVGVEPQGQFVNGAAIGNTSLAAVDLLDQLLAIERERGRVRPHLGAPRTLDLDLILYGGQILKTPGLQVPHPRFRERLFVLEPLAEIAGEWKDPATGHTVRELLEAARARA